MVVVNWVESVQSVWYKKGMLYTSILWDISVLIFFKICNVL